MTNAELNRDIKRLAKTVEKYDGTSYSEETDNKIRAELKRLYYADSGFTAMNRQSILIMIRLNGRYRVIPLHQFGIKIII